MDFESDFRDVVSDLTVITDRGNDVDIVDCGRGGGSTRRWRWWIQITGSWDLDDEEEVEMM